MASIFFHRVKGQSEIPDLWQEYWKSISNKASFRIELAPPLLTLLLSILDGQQPNSLGHQGPIDFHFEPIRSLFFIMNLTMKTI